MTLKVGGSNPSIYPILLENKLVTFQIVLEKNKLKQKSRIKLQNLNLKTILIKLLMNAWNFSSLNKKLVPLWWTTVAGLCKLKDIKKSTKLNFLQKDFKLLGTANSIDKVFTSGNILNNNFKSSTFTNNYLLLKTFKTFLLSNTASNSTLYVPHASFSTFYLSHFKGGSIILNISKFFKKWKLAYALLYNLFFYKIPLLVFTPSFFKSENLAINWVELKQFSFLWRYIKPFLTFKSNKINDYGEFIFRKLKILGFNVGLITDVLYHSKSIYYLRRLNYYSIGLVPTIYHAKTLDLAIPTTNDSLISQVFFIRFVLKIKKVSLSARLLSLRKLWKN